MDNIRVSELAKEFVRTFFMMVNYYSIERSMQIAIETLTE